MSSPVIRMTQNMWHFKYFKPFHIVARKFHCCTAIERCNVGNRYSFYICKQFFGSSSAQGKSMQIVYECIHLNLNPTVKFNNETIN